MASIHEEEVLGKAYDSRLMKRLIGYLGPYKWQVALALGAIVLKAGADVLGPYLTKVAIDKYLARTAGASNSWLGGWLSSEPLTGIAEIGAIYVGLLLFGFGLDFLQTYYMQWTGQKVMFDLRSQIFRHLQRMDVGFFDKNPVGRLVTRVTTDVDALNEMFTAGVVAIFEDIFVLIGIIAIMLRMNWKLALIAFAVLPFIIVATKIFRDKVRDSYRRIRVAIARINAYLQEHVSGMIVLQLFNREERAFNKFSDVNRQHMDAQDLSEKYNILQSAMASSERVFKLIDTAAEVTTPTKAVAPAGAGRIDFDHVWFAYRNIPIGDAPTAEQPAQTPGSLTFPQNPPEAQPTFQSAEPDWVLRDVSFSIEPGETVAIVGHTGAGKTTIISLLMRFYDVRQGAVRIDGVDVKDMDLAELRRRFGVVLQDPFLFTGTVEGNIRLGTEWIADEDVKKAAEDVNLSDFIHALPGGFKEPVHERGSTLSTGQKQLISFARALAHDPKILILDEATSSVDTETEFRVREALSRMVEGRTSVIIAHRLSTVQRADKIIVMHKGKVREMGTHQQLLANRGIYYKLYQLQYKDQEIPAPTPSQPTVTANADD
jgi:ATP-binding cassette subfamily B protein